MLTIQDTYDNRPHRLNKIRAIALYMISHDDGWNVLQNER